MASFRKRNNLWQAQVRKKGVSSRAKSFYQKKDARAWADEEERLMQTGGFGKKDTPLSAGQLVLPDETLTAGKSILAYDQRRRIEIRVRRRMRSQ